MPTDVPTLYSHITKASKSPFSETGKFSRFPIWIVDGGCDGDMTGDVWLYLRTSRTVDDARMAYRIDAMASYLNKAGCNVIGVWPDNGTSAVNKAPFERVALLQVVSKAMKANAIVCTTLLSRFIRKNKSGFYEAEDIEWILNAGVRFATIINPFLSESEQHSQAIKLGLEAAERQCKVGGRPKADDAQLVAGVMQLKGTRSYRAIAKQFGIDDKTVKRIIQDHDKQSTNPYLI